ncbi:c-type cytochrome [Haliea sp. E17]|uniref:c-type cytochrome n=1 Tax=Haliea sp. E17 TaxID=3401576 RepID=UPI003AAA786E
MSRLAASGLFLLAQLLLLSLAYADERRLAVLDSSGRERFFPVETLLAEFGSREVTVFDPQFGVPRSYRGVPLRPLLAALGLADEDLVLECTDGYSIALPKVLLADPALEPVLALADSEPSPGLHWQLYPHGREMVNFDPFYLVWAVRDVDPHSAAAGERVAELPWPYQLTRLVPADRYYLPSPPPATAQAVRAGYASYVSHCVKCHRLQGVGGAVGPELDRSGGMLQVLDDSQLQQLILQVTDYFPRTKMPVYAGKLGEGELRDLVNYLRWMTAGDRPPG